MIDKLIKLKTENPDLPIKTMTYYEVCAEDSGYWLGKISNIDIDYVMKCDEKMFTDEDAIREEIKDWLCGDEKNSELSDDAFEELIDKQWAELLAKGEIEKAIIIYIGLP
jgi:hypothetical protein